MKVGKQLGVGMMTERVIREINKEKQLLAEPEPINVADGDEAIMIELGHTNDGMMPTELHPHLAPMDTDGPHDQQPNNMDKPTPSHPRPPNQAQKTKAHSKTPQKTPTTTTQPPKKEEGDTNIPTNQPANKWDGCLHRQHQKEREREGAVKNPTGQRKKVECLFLMPFIAIMALHLLLVPTTHTEGPALLLPLTHRVHRRYTLPLRHRHGNKRGPNPHGYRMWRPCLLLLYIACFFHTPTAPNTGVPSRYYRAPVSIAALPAPTTHVSTTTGSSNAGTPKDIPAPARMPQRGPVPLLDIEEYPQYLVVNTNRRYDGLDDMTNARDHNMKLATWNIQGAQGSVTLQR